VSLIPKVVLQPMIQSINWARALPKPLQAPLAGVAWVLIIMMLAWRGVSIGHLYRYLVLTGLLNGGVLSILVASPQARNFRRQFSE
jgi:hypothetical protein